MKCASSVCPLEADDDKVLEGWRCQKMEGASPCVTVGRRAPPPHQSTKGHLSMPSLPWVWGCSYRESLPISPPPEVNLWPHLG